MDMEITLFVIIAIAIVALSVFFYYVPFFLWISARVSGVNISLLQLFLMRIRKVPANVITQALIEAHKAGLSEITRDDLEAHYLAGGNVVKVVHALVSAAKANIDLGFKMATITSLVVPLLILAIPIFDTLLAILRRLLKGEKL